VPASDAGTDVVSAEDIEEDDLHLSPLTDRDPLPPAPAPAVPGQAEDSEASSGPGRTAPPEMRPPSADPAAQPDTASAAGGSQATQVTPPPEPQAPEQGRSAFFQRFRQKMKMDPGTKTKAFMATSSRQSRGIRSLTTVNFGNQTSETETRTGWRGRMARLVASPMFEVVFAFAILINTVVMAVQVQYRGLGVGFYVGHHSVRSPAEELWPAAEDTFYGLELFFGALFSVELLFKVLATDYRFFMDIWNLLDFAVVVGWFIDTLAAGVFPVDPLLLRLLRLLKLFRMLRLVRTIQGFDSLYVMITSIKGSIAALFWSVILLVLVLMMVSLFLVTMLENYIKSDDQELERRMDVYLYFGTFSRAMLSLFEMTLANWAPPSRALTENVNEFWMFFVLSFQLLVGFSVMKVIMGVFLQVTFYVASNDDVIMMSQKERALKVHTQKMTELFVAADENGNGRLDQDEFETIISDPTCIAWLSAMGFETSMLSGQDLYRLLCAEGTNDLSAEELCKGVAELKGPATSLNLALLQKDQVATKELMDQMVMSMVKLQARLKFSDMHKAKTDSSNSSSSTDSDDDETDAQPLTPASRSLTPGTISQGRGKRLGLAAASSRKTRGTRRTPGGAVSQVLFKQKSLGSLSGGWNVVARLRNFTRPIVASFQFEAVFGVLICLNTLVMALQSEYNGLDTGYNLGFPGISSPAIESWPGVYDIFWGLELFFGIVFTAEIILKLSVFYHYFFLDMWNSLDFLVVAVWYLETSTTSESLPIDPMVLRLFRLVKLGRVVRLVRILEKYDALYLMLTSIKGSMAALAWSSILLLVVQMMLSLVMATVLEAYFLDDNWPGDKLKVYDYYGTFSRSMLTMFEITLANFIPVTRVMVTNFSQAYLIFGLMHKFFIGFAVVMVITGVFIQETMKVAQTDNTIMLTQRERSSNLHTRKIKTLFDMADSDGSGRLDMEEFVEVCEDTSMKIWLSAMGLDVSDAKGVFQLISEQLDSEDLSARELVAGVARLKGAARNIDLAMLRQENQEILKRVNQLQKTLNEIGESIECEL